MSALLVTLAVVVGVLSGCGGDNPRQAQPATVRLGTYLGQLCEAIGPFELAAQSFGAALDKDKLALKSRKSKDEMEAVLTAVIDDSGHVVATIEAVGVPDVANGRGLAASMVATFDRIRDSDAVWRAELRAGAWSWPDRFASRAKLRRLRTSIGAREYVGHQFDRLPATRESQNAMANSPVCREQFGGSIAVGGHETDPAASGSL